MVAAEFLRTSYNYRRTAVRRAAFCMFYYYITIYNKKETRSTVLLPQQKNFTSGLITHYTQSQEGVRHDASP